MTQLPTSRERMLRALRHQDVDHAPCAFMSFSAMRGRCQDAYEVVERELDLGLDSLMFIPSSWRNIRPNHTDLRGLPVRLPTWVDTRLWMEELPGEQYPVLHKEYRTPTGTLTTLVRKTEDWPHGNFVPLMEDYQIPRAIKPLVTNQDDLNVLRSLLQPPSAEDVAEFHREVERARAFCAHHGILLAGGWGVGADMVGWLCGLQQMALMSLDQPELLQDLLDTIAAWNAQRMRVILEAGVDVYIRRGWYEGTDFWSPALYRRFLLPLLQREAALAHEHDTLFGYIMTTGALPMIPNLLQTDIDVLIGVDPLQAGPAPMETLRDALGGRICLWGGVNGALTVEEGTPAQVREAVEYALTTMHGTNGFILSPVDNVCAITRNAWRNVDVLVEAWQQRR